MLFDDGSASNVILSCVASNNVTGITSRDFSPFLVGMVEGQNRSSE